MTIHDQIQRRLWRTALVCFVLGLACLSFINCAPSKLGKALDVGVGVASAADYLTTRQSLERGGVEQNPLIGASSTRLAVAKVGGAAGMIALADWVERMGKPTLAHVLRSISITAWTGAAIHNHGVQR